MWVATSNSSTAAQAPPEGDVFAQIVQSSRPDGLRRLPARYRLRPDRSLFPGYP
jgi:hypothetical protein